MKKINLVNLEMDINESIDADDYGHRLVTCVEELVDSNNVVNLVKIKVGEHVIPNELQKLLEPIRQGLTEMGATNCVFVPLIKGYIEDVTVDSIEVKHDADC